VSAVASTLRVPLARPFRASLSGNVTQEQVAGCAIIQLMLSMAGQVNGQLRIRLGGLPIGSGGLSMTASQVDLSAAGMPEALDGRVVSLPGGAFEARRGSGG